MPQSGGSAAIYGILYQILGSIHWAAYLCVDLPVTDTGEIESTSLILEPRHGGGDIQVQSPHRRIVEQWKAKSSQGTWSLVDLVERVLPDLYLAVDDSNLGDLVEYRFVTEGRRGQWTNGMQFFEQLCQMVPDDGLSALDPKTLQEFGNGVKQTERDFFIWIADRVREVLGDRVYGESSQVTYRKLWHLLSRFKFHGQRTIADLERDIGGLLSQLITFREDIDVKRRELCGLILELGGRGETRVTAQELLSKVGLTGQSLGDLARLSETQIRWLERSFRRNHYRPEMDVRPQPTWSASTSVLVVAGESGQGKTWRLCAVGKVMSAPGSLVVFVRATGNVDDDLNEAARVIWQEMLGRAASPPLHELPARLASAGGLTQTPSVTVLLDDVRDPEEAHALVERTSDWPGFHLGLGTTLEIGRAVARSHPEQASLLRVDDFTNQEMHVYLELNGHDWTRLPLRLNNTLRRPLLAKLFCDLAESEGWHPNLEHQIIEKFWGRIEEYRRGPILPGSAARLGALALTILDPKTSYPWTQTALAEVGITDEIQSHLEAAGWLTRLVDEGRVEMWHNRLLVWSIAKGLIEQRRNNSITTSQLVERVRSIDEMPARRELLITDRLLEDLVWILCDRRMQLIPDALSLIETYEARYPDWTYKNLLPRLGSRMIPLLESRLRNVTDRTEHVCVYLIASTMHLIAEWEQEPVLRAALDWLFDPHEVMQEASMLVLAKHGVGDESILDRLWKIHSRNAAGLESEQGQEWVHRHLMSWGALRACIQENPGWLDGELSNSEPSSPLLDQLAFLLASMPMPIGSEMWQKHRDRLLGNPRDEALRPLCRCIRRYGDATDVARLSGWMKHEAGLVAAEALAAAARISPAWTIESLPGMNRNMLRFFVKWWLPELLLRSPGQTQIALRLRFGFDLSDRVFLADLYQSIPDEMDDETTRVLLEALDQVIDQCLSLDPSQHDPRLSILLETFNKTWSPTTLERIWTLSGTSLEEKLLRIAVRATNIGLAGYVEAKQLGDLLFKIGGVGITQLTNSWLRRPEFQFLLAGLTWSLVNPDTDTRKILAEMATGRARPDTPEAVVVRRATLLSLASLQECDVIGRSILLYPAGYSRELKWLLAGSQPFGEDIVREAVLFLQKDDPMLRVGALWVLGLSGRKDAVSDIQQALTRIDPASSEVGVLVKILRMLGASDGVTVEFLRSQLAQPKYRRAAFKTLLEIGTDSAVGAARESVSGLRSNDVGAALRLQLLNHEWINARNNADRVSIANSIWRHIQESGRPRVTNLTLEALGDSDDRAVREFLVEEVFKGFGDSPDPDRITAAITGLAKRDVEIAFRLGTRAMEEGWEDVDPLPQLLLDLNPGQANEFLLDHMTRERQSWVRWSIGRALRHVGDHATIGRSLRKMAEAPDPLVREAAAEMAGWSSHAELDEVLRQLALEDGEFEVRRAAQRSLRCRSRLHSIRLLMNSFQGLNSPRKWVVLEGILALGDPILLDDPADQLSLTALLGERPSPMWVHAREILEKRTGQLKDRARRIDRDRGGDY
ncbi:MAG: HEAT repeat domain-containing protein [Acidobacteria bacterium]|nr:HEAT repeat domain-containing protein [Acidobacteriota bacterium]